MPNRFALICCALIWCALLTGSLAGSLPAADFGGNDQVPLPELMIDGWEVQLIDAEASLVTPTACCFDSAGRLYVIECHTHFPPEDYKGPKQDRIYHYRDTDGDGRPDRRETFYAGGIATMGMVALPDDSIAVVTRSDVKRLADRDGDGTAEVLGTLLTLETEADYPHNGLGGIALGPDGKLYVGQGENFGAPYTLTAADRSQQVGGGEGGNVFRCTVDGTELERIATGFWNPFGLTFDRAGRLWTVGNDPDQMPPCRLLQVVAGGDYGFQFRFGRAGTHPLQAWDGELPGTLPMAAGTGEAPCAVVDYDDSLWVTSWGDNRLERYRMAPRGASWSSKTEVVVQGNATFRPVGIAVAPDGALWVTDWVDRSYPVHGRGRLWRFVPPATVAESAVAAAQQRPRQLDASLRTTAADVEVHQAFAAEDPFVRQQGIVQQAWHEDLLADASSPIDDPRPLAGSLSAARWRELCDPTAVPVAARAKLIARGLQSNDARPLLVALRWAAERACRDQLPAIEAVLQRRTLPPRVFRAAIAAAAYLQSGTTRRGGVDQAQVQRLVELVGDTQRPVALRALALRSLPAEGVELDANEVAEWALAESDRSFGIVAIRWLDACNHEAAAAALARLVEAESLPAQTRADALATLAGEASRHARLLSRMRLPRQPEPLRQEAKRLFQRGTDATDPRKPAATELDAWMELVGSGGDVDAGRRVFFRTTCANCHAYQGRGASTGPDLSTLAGQTTRRRVLESILQPSKEMGPMYVPWRVLTVDGRLLTGLKLDRPGVGQSLRFQGADGGFFEVPLEDIERQEPARQSVMPTGLENGMSLAELRDLLAFLLDPK